MSIVSFIKILYIVSLSAFSKSVSKCSFFPPATLESLLIMTSKILGMAYRVANKNSGGAIPLLSVKMYLSELTNSSAIFAKDFSSF